MTRRDSKGRTLNQTADERISRSEAREIADAVVQARKRAGMTQAQIASAMGISQSAFARLESPATLPRLSTLQRFARATSSRLHLTFDPVSNHEIGIASHSMTETLSPTPFASDRRRLIGTAMGLAGMLGVGNTKHISAQEATAAAASVDDYTYVAPEWGEETALFTITDRTETSVSVETIDGTLEIPASPARIVSLDDEYVPLFELGIADNIVGIGDTTGSGTLDQAGDLTEDLHATLAEVPFVGTAWELDPEAIIVEDPDLILGNANYQGDDVYGLLSDMAPFIRKNIRVTDVPRGAIRDFGALFQQEEAAATYQAEHDAYIARAKEAIASVAEGKRVVVGMDIPETSEFWTVPSYFMVDGSVASRATGYPFFRELGLTPTNFIESISDAEDRASFYLTVSMEQFGLIDADILFYVAGYGEEQFQAFLENPVVQGSEAYKNDSIHYYDALGHGFGLAGIRSSVKWIVEELTGEPFE